MRICARTLAAEDIEVRRMKGPLEGLLVLDLSRILAGPTCTQLLGDFGAEIVKIERPGAGNDTRRWGPPFLEERDGSCDHSAYFSNRNKRSVAVDLSKPDGAELIRRLAVRADVLVENYKVGGLAKYGLDYSALSPLNRRLVYCSISGFSQTGPNAHQLGYDALIQTMGGIMSLTGEPDGAPMTVGVGIADVVCGLYAANAIQAALHAREKTGRGQYIDIALYDSQVSWLINEATNYLISGQAPQRRGMSHPNIVPFQVFATADGHVMLAVGNDAQFARFAATADYPAWADRARLVPLAAIAMLKRPTGWWVETLTLAEAPCGPVRDLPAVFADDQCVSRELKVSLGDRSSVSGDVTLVGNPIKLSETPITYRVSPPRLGADTIDVLKSQLTLSSAEIAELQSSGIIG
jgi:crotonobetainyl-CoA:carnitine CoA-transferase CaiB-like acyl-CoA transferase